MSVRSSDTVPLLPKDLRSSLWQRPAVHRVLIASVFFAAIAPTLTWLEFAGGMENFNVATALECVRDGHWAVPTMGGLTRIEKPPLVEWITAWGTETSGNLAWGARWPSLLAACLALVAVYELGRTLVDWRVGLVSASACGTSLIFLKFARQASYDLHLALWVIVTNVFLARALLRGRRAANCAAAGVALGLAVMCKGPVAVVQTVAPFALVVGFARWRGIPSSTFDPQPLSATGQPPPLVGDAPMGSVVEEVNVNPFDHLALDRGWVWPALLGVAMLLLVSLPWPLYVAWKMRGSWQEWYDEVTLKTEAEIEHKTGWHTYLVIFLPMMVPWAIWFVTGLVDVIFSVLKPRTPERFPAEGSGRESRTTGRPVASEQRQSRAPVEPSAPAPLVLAVAWTFVPIAVMIFFAARRDRYLLPMYGPASVIAAWGVLRHVPHWGRWNKTQAILLALHGVILAALAVGLPLAGAFSAPLPLPDRMKVTTPDGAPWYSPGFALGAAAFAVGTAAASVAWYRRRWGGFVGGTVALALLSNVVFVWGYRQGEGNVGAGPRAADAILSTYPDADIYNARSDLRKILPQLFLIYLNRDVVNLNAADALPPTDRPQVLIFPPDPAHPGGPPSVPAGFSPLAERKLNEGIYRMYVRPAKKRNP